MNLLKIRKWEEESSAALLSVFIFSVSEEEVEVMDTKLQISSHSNKSHQPVFTGRLNKLHRVVKKNYFKLTRYWSVRTSEVSIFTEELKQKIIINDTINIQLVFCPFRKYLDKCDGKLKLACTNLTGMRMLLQENCEKLFFHWVIHFKIFGV